MLQTFVLPGRQNQAAATTVDPNQLPILQATTAHFVRVQAEHGCLLVPEQPRGGAGTAHAMPLIAQATGVEDQRKASVTVLLRCLKGLGDEARAAILRGEDAVAIQADGPRRTVAGERPLLWAALVEQTVTEPGKVQVAIARQRLVLLEQRLGVFEGEQAGLPRTQAPFEATGEIACDRPVRSGLAGRCDGAAHMADAALGVGDRAFLLAPTDGGQQQVGIAAGFGGEEGFLHDDEGTGRQRLVNLLLIRQGLCGVGAGDPQGLDSTIAYRLEQLDGGKSGAGWQLLDTPMLRHFGAMLRIAGFAMTGQQVGQATGLAPAHGIGLPGEREGTGPRTADLPGGQVQIDQRAVLGATRGGLIQAHAPEAEKGWRAADHPRAALQGLDTDAAELGDYRRGVFF